MTGASVRVLPEIRPGAHPHLAAVRHGRMRPMTELDEHGRPEPPVAAGEVATLLGFLDYQRATLAWKCSGLDAAGLRATTAASAMTLGGMYASWFGGSRGRGDHEELTLRFVPRLNPLARALTLTFSGAAEQVTLDLRLP